MHPERRDGCRHLRPRRTGATSSFGSLPGGEKLLSFSPKFLSDLAHVFSWQSDRVSYEHFRFWVLRNADATTITKWLLKEPASVTLSNDLETPTFYQTLAGVTHCECCVTLAPCWPISASHWSWMELLSFQWRRAILQNLKNGTGTSRTSPKRGYLIWRRWSPLCLLHYQNCLWKVRHVLPTCRLWISPVSSTVLQVCLLHLMKIEMTISTSRRWHVASQPVVVVPCWNARNVSALS